VRRTLLSAVFAPGFASKDETHLSTEREQGLAPVRRYSYNLAAMSEALVIARLGPVFSQGVLCLRGPLTAENLSPFQNAIRKEVGPIVILDLDEVPYIDSAGLGSLVSAYVTCHKSGRQLVLAGINDRILKLFEITRVESLFLMFATVDEAIEAFEAPARA
jgi:anti-anti-sigma factor